MADDQRPANPSVTHAAGPAPARFTADEYDMLIRSGAAAKLGRIELRKGEIYRMSPQFAPHMRMKMALIFAFKAAVERAGLTLEVGSEGTVRYPDFMPQPDILLFETFSRDGPIPGETVRLIVEVADTTLADDLGPKRDLYAASGVAEHWVVDLVGKTVLQHAEPKEGVFTRARTVRRGEVADALTLAGLRIETAGMPWD